MVLKKDQELQVKEFFNSQDHPEFKELLDKIKSNQISELHSSDIKTLPTVPDTWLEEIGEALELSTSITSVDLRELELGDQAAGVFARVLKGNKYLEKLDLSTNCITCKCAELLAIALQSNNPLKSLSLNNNDIGSHELEGVGNKAIGYIKNLFGYNANPGIDAIAKLIECNETLESLEIESNRIDLLGSGQIFHSLKKNYTLKTLAFDDNEVDFVRLVVALESNKKGIDQISLTCKSREESNFIFSLLESKNQFTDTLGLYSSSREYESSGEESDCSDSSYGDLLGG